MALRHQLASDSGRCPHRWEDGTPALRWTHDSYKTLHYTTVHTSEMECEICGTNAIPADLHDEALDDLDYRSEGDYE